MIQFAGRSLLAIGLLQAVLFTPFRLAQAAEPLPAALAALTDGQKKAATDAGRDVLGDKELNAAGDPSFASVSRHFPAMKGPREVLGAMEGAQDICVLPDASLSVGQATARFTVNGAAASGVVKHLLEGYLPIVVARWEAGGLKCQQTALGWSPQMGADTPLAGLVRLRVTNPGKEPCKAQVQLVLAQPAATWSLELPPGGEQTVYTKIHFAAAASAVKIDATEFDKCLAEVNTFWDALLRKGMKIRVPEQRVNDAYRAWLAWNFIDVDKRGNVYEPHDGGGGFYEEVYGYSASRYCAMLDLYGYHDEAQRYLDSLLTFVQPSGLLLVNYGLPDTGVQLWAMGRHYRLTGDEAWLRKVAPTMLKMCDFIVKTRKASMDGQAKDAPWHGLIKYRPYCDEPTAAFSYHTDTYLLLGLEETAAALRGIGMTVESDRLDAEAAAYRKDVLDSMDKAVIAHDGMKMLPIFPETQALLKRVGYSGRDYYSLVGCMVLETDVLPAEDHRARWITDLLEQRDGLCLGACTFHDGIDHAYTYGYWMNCLKRNEAKKAILGFYTSLAYGMSRGTYAGVEVTFLRTGANEPTLPHLYSGTQQLLLLRNMLLREEGDTLVLAQAVPRLWLEGGKEVRVDDAETLFGKLSYSIKSHDGAARITVAINPPAKRPPKSIVVYLRHPAEKSIRSATVNGVATKDFSKDTVTLPSATGPTTIEVQY